MDRPTLTIETPVDKKQVVLKAYITGREKRALTNVFLNGDLQFSASGKEVKGIKGELIEKAEDLALRTIVVEVDGITDDVVNAVLNMHAQDYAFVVEEVNKITADTKGDDVKKN
jgi:hypothetical protein